MAGLGPRVLQVLEFANARAPELQALHELTQHHQFSNDTDDKIETQKNQRRRRANAFKSHKMPQRLRAAPKKSGSLRCRKHKRRPHTLLQERSSLSEADADRPHWLPSHLYHAKRMAMVAQYGYVLAAHRLDKSVSASLQAVRTKATIHDVSYYGVIELYGLPSVILTALQLISDPSGSDFHGRRFLAGDEEGHSMLYHVGRYPQGAIAPVTFMWRPLKRDYDGDRFMLQEDWQSTKRQLWLWVHPAAYMESATAIATACQEVGNTDEDGIEMLDRRGQLCRLKLRGRIADKLVASIASDVVDTISDVDKDGGVDDQDAQDENASDHEDGFDEKETVDRCCSGNRLSLLRTLSRRRSNKQRGDDQKDSLYAVAIKDPRLARWKKGALCNPLVYADTGLSLLNEPPANAVPDVGSDVIESPLSGISLSSLGKTAEEPESEAIIKELQALLTWTTCSSTAARTTESGRLQYPGAIDSGEQSKLDAMADEREVNYDPMPNSLLWSSSRRSKIERNFLKDHKLNEAIFQYRKGSKLGHSLDVLHMKSQAVHLIMIEKQEPYPHTSGWDIVCLPSSVSSILKTLVFGGAMVVGLEEDAALHTALHQPSFPCDYPDAQAGQVYWEARARDLEIEQAKKPKAKRFGNGKHGVNSSFQPRWELLFDDQKPEDDVNDEDRVIPCVIRGETYLKPFSFYRSRNATADVDEAMSLPTSGINSIVPVAMPTLVRVVVVVPRRGNINVNAMLFAPSAEDVDKYKNDDSWNGFDAGMEKMNRVTSVEKDERSLIGFVTSAIYDRPKSAFRAVGFIACKPFQQLFVANKAQRYRKQHHCALAMLRSPQGRMVRPVLVQVET